MNFRRAALAILGLALSVALGARPAFIDGTGVYCASCHSVQPSAVVSFLSVDGAPVGATVSAVPDQVLGVIWRVQGLSGGGAVGAFVHPSAAKSGFEVGTGPQWTDNSRSGATAWATGSSVAWRSALGGAQGQTPDNGSLSDLNGLADDEVFSVSLTVKATTPGFYAVELGAAANPAGQRYASKALNVQVLAVSPSVTPTLSPSPLPATPSPTATATPDLSPTPTCTASPTPASLSDESFTGVVGAGFLASPIHDGILRVWLDLSASADAGELRVYSANFVRLASLSLGPLPKGRSRQDLLLPDLAAQALWVQVQVQKNGRWRPGPILLTYLLR